MQTIRYNGEEPQQGLQVVQENPRMILTTRADTRSKAVSMSLVGRQVGFQDAVFTIEADNLPEAARWWAGLDAVPNESSAMSTLPDDNGMRRAAFFGRPTQRHLEIKLAAGFEPTAPDFGNEFPPRGEHPPQFTATHKPDGLTLRIHPDVAFSPLLTVPFETVVTLGGWALDGLDKFTQ